MCDTLVALGRATKDGRTLFAKNSDREPNEAQYLFIQEAADHPKGSMVQCTYIEIPQVSHTNKILLSRPFWMWGGEMGVNEHGLAIGNEAVFTKIPYTKNGGLLGMDLLRLALERAAEAEEAVFIITALLKEFGQGGNCGYRHNFYYHNSFLLADPEDAWVLETAGPHWAAKRIQEIYSISNGLTIGRDWDRSSEDLVRYAVRKGWCKGEKDFHFARCYSDFLYTRFSNCTGRRARTFQNLSDKMGSLDAPTMMTLLRDHDDWHRPDTSLTGSTVCMHAGFGPVRGSQTVGSLVSVLDGKTPLHLVTATAAPCTAIFKPVWLDAGLPNLGPTPTGRFDEGTIFWRHERLHRQVLKEFSPRLAEFSEERDALEKSFFQQAVAASTLSAEKRKHLTQVCFEEADKKEQTWYLRVKNRPVQKRAALLYRMAWMKFNREAQMPKDW